MNNMKKCNKCCIEKSFDEFYSDKSNNINGKKNICKTCEKQQKNERKINNINYVKKISLSRRKKYEEICKYFENNKCKFLTTKEDYENIIDINLTNIKYEVTCCNKIIESTYTNFRHKKNKDKCYKCNINIINIKEKLSKNNSNRNNEFNVPNLIYQEYCGYLYIKELLEKDFIIKKNINYGKSDFIIKQKNNDNDEWIKVQLKTTSHIQNYQYIFALLNKNYDDHLLILLSIEYKNMWFLNGNISKDIKKLHINKNSNKYKNNEINKENIIYETNNYYNSLKKFSEKESNKLINKYLKRECEFYKKRENMSLNVKIEYPEIEGTIYDVIINNYKVQDKVYSIVDKINYNIYIVHKCNKKYIPYNKGDNDFYWLWLNKSDYFFIIPENILIEQHFIKTPRQNINKKYITHIYIRPHENDKIKYWYNNYKYDLKDKELATKINNLFTIK